MTERLDIHVDRESGLSPDLVLGVWHRRKWLAFAVFCAALAGSTTIARSLPNLYSASATVIVERQQVSEAFVRPSVTAELETRIQMIDQRVKSRARLEQLITRLNLYPELRSTVPMDDLVEKTRRNLPLRLKGIDPATGGRNATIAFTVTYTGRSPAVVADVANTMASFYIEENTQSREGQADQTAAFLKDQLAQVKIELDLQEGRTGDFTSRHTDELPQQLPANLGALDRLNTRLSLNGEYQIRLLDRRDRLEQELATGALPTTIAPPIVDTASPAAQLVRVKQELAETLRQYSERYPDVIRLRQQVASLERQLAATGGGAAAVAAAVAAADPAERSKRALGDVEDELASLKQEESGLRRSIGAYETRVQSAPRREQEIQELSRGYDATRERYQALQRQYQDAQVSASLEQDQVTEQFRVLDPAIPPARPTAPDRLWLQAMGLAGAIVLAVLSVTIVERLDTTFHTVDDLRAFVDLPTLASIRQIPTATGVRRQRYRFAVMGLSVAVGLALIVAGSYYVAAGNEQIVRLTARASGG